MALFNSWPNEKEREDDEKHKGLGLKKQFKYWFFSGIILSVLVWGSWLMLVAIADFRKSEIFNKQVEGYINSHSPPLLKSPGSSSPNKVDLNGLIPLDLPATRNSTFRAKSRTFQWFHTEESSINDKGTYLINENNTYLIKSVADQNDVKVIYEGESFIHKGITYDIDSLIASPNLSKALLKTNSTHNWRHSTRSLYWILDIFTNSTIPLFNEKQKLSVASWSPDSKKISFVYENNIFLYSLVTDKTIQVTSDGDSQVFNGIPDWVYEEEVYGGDLAMWWSPSSSKIVFLKLNDTYVPEIPIPYYVQDGYENYPELRKIKYPKAGYPNPIVELVLYDLSKDVSEVIDLNSDKISPDNRLITEVFWVNEDVITKVSNRPSDLIEVFIINTKDFSANLVRSDKAEDSWFEITRNGLSISKNESAGLSNDGYIDTVVENGYNHLAFFSPPDNHSYTLLTKGNWEVVSGVNAFDVTNQMVYFTATKKSSVERHLYSVNLVEALAGLPLVQEITKGEGWYAGSFSPGAKFLSLTYNGPLVPHQQLLDLDNNLKLIAEVESNDEVRNNVAKYAIPESRFKVVTLIDDETKESFEVNAVETLPWGFNKDHQYPVIFYVYGGPGSQLVTKTFSVGFSSALASELNCIVVTVDGRGTGFNNHNPKLGSNFKFTVRDRLGYYEARDQIAAAKEWSKQPYVDSSKIAIWGWSYGGYLTLKTLETDYVDRVFSYGVSVAPVTQWNFYDSIYTERYMNTPQDNAEGYKNAAIHNATNFNSVKRFFIAHGSGDDNVHVQNSLKLIDNFNQADIQNFDFMIFPDSDHSIRYHNGNKVIYDRILQFFRRAFNNEF